MRTSLLAILVAGSLLIGVAGVWLMLHQSVPASPTIASSALAENSVAMRKVHTPAIVVVDVQLDPGECHYRTVDAATGSYLPDGACTPGAVDTAVTQANIAQTICRSGYTATVRPPEAATSKFKNTSYPAYSETYSRTTELDHLVPLELGGASSASNLWVEPNAANAQTFRNPKDDIENDLNKAVCNRRVTLAAAQQAIASDWTTARQVLGLG